MISKSTEHDHVRLDMTVEDYNLLLLFLGTTLGVLKQQRDDDLFWPFLELTNEMNAGNPDFMPYEIPPEHRGKRNRLVSQLAAYADKQRAD